MNSSRLGLITLLTIFALSAMVVPAGAQTVEITFWYTEGSVEAGVYDTLIADYEAANPNVDIQALQQGYFDTESSYENALIAGTQPDVLRADVTWITKWANQEVLEPLDSYDEDFNDFIPESLRLVQWRGATFGLPQVVDTLGLMYNKHTLEMANISVPADGFTFDKFAEAAFNLTDRSSTNQDDWKYGYTSAHMTYHFLPIFYGKGAKYFEPNAMLQKNIALNSSETREAIQYLDNLIGNVWADPTAPYKAVTPSRDLQTYANLNEFFMNGKVAIIQQGPWELRNILDNGAMFNKDAYQTVIGSAAPSWVGPDNLGFMTVPKKVDTDGTVTQGMHIGGHAYVMSNRADNKDETFKFMKYLASPEATYLRAKENHLVSPRKSFYTGDVNTSDSYVPADDQFIKGFKLNLDKSFDRPVNPNFIIFDGFFAAELDKHLLETQDIEETIDKTLTKFNNYFEQFGEIPEELPTTTSGTDSTSKPPTQVVQTEEGPLSIYMLFPALFVGALVYRRKLK